MSDDLTLEQIDRIIANHESGVQLTGVTVYRQLAGVMRERDALWDAAITARTYVHNGYAIQAERLLVDVLTKMQSGELRKP